MAYDFVVVGSGMFGAAFAREAAHRGKKVLVLEKRAHVGGMCYTENGPGYPVHTYGPHVFHTNDDRVWTWVNDLWEWRTFSVRTKCVAKGRLWSFPINLFTLYQLWDVRTPEEAKSVLAVQRLPGQDQTTIEGWCLANYGREVYETFIYGYTRKQWGRDPAKLPASIVRRLPFRLTHDDNYFRDRYQAVPVGGFGPFFERLLDHDLIEVKRELDYFSDAETFNRLGKVVYSGRIDEFFGFCHGTLAFRSCRWENTIYEGDFQGNPVVNYADIDVPYTRIIEHKHFTDPEAPTSIVSYEHPFEAGPLDAPLYPVRDKENEERYAQYASIPTNVVFAGRLGCYRYFDMCEVIAQAFKLADTLC